MYKLDLSSLLQLVLEFRQSGVLITKLQGFHGIKGNFQALVFVAYGEVSSCSILDNNGQALFSGNDALRLLYGLGVLNWTLNQDTSSSDLNQSSNTLPSTSQPGNDVNFSSRSASFSFVPRRQAPIDPYVMNSWPRKHRHVYVLIDGKKDVETIARLLTFSPSEVENVLRDLQSVNAIILE